MDHLDTVQSFIERCERAPPVRELATVFEGALQRMGFRHFACCSHADPLRPPHGAVMLHNYPPVWMHAFSEGKLYEVDPVFRHAERTAMPFFWDTAADLRIHLTTQQREIFAAASSLGLAHGYTIPFHRPWEQRALRGSCSVVPDTGPIDRSAYHAVHLMAMYLYEAASRENAPPTAAREPIVLSERERECLTWWAMGKSEWTISQLLHISESTVHTHIERAKRRMGVATRQQAIIHALQDGQIALGDITRDLRG